MKFEKYKIKVDTYAPGLRPRFVEKDKKAIQDLYLNFESRFNGVESQLEDLGVEKLVITFIKRGGVADED